MNADFFYEKLRDAIVWFGLGWDEKHLIRVRISGNQLCFEHNNTEIRMTIPVMYVDS